MATLNQQQKVFIVQRLACFGTPAEVVKEVKETFGVDASRAQVLFYDPDSAAGSRELSAELAQLFRTTREAFLADSTRIPVANRSYRLRRLQELLDRPEIARNAVQVREILAQAAKEMGGQYTNRRELTGAGGGPVRVQQEPLDLSALSDEELANLERLLGKTTAGDAGEGLHSG